MTTSSHERLARLAGAAYLVMFVTGSFPIWVRMGLVKAGDADSTVTNILESEMLFRLSIVSELIMAVTWLCVAFILFRLFEDLNKSVASFFLLLVAVGVATICANLVFQVGALILARGEGALASFDQDHTRASAMFFLTLFSRGWTVSGLFTGLWLLPLGYLVFTSGWFPKVLGALLMAGCLGYLVPVVTVFLLPSHQSWNLPAMSVSGIAEISFGLWLLVRGVPTKSAAVPLTGSA